MHSWQNTQPSAQRNTLTRTAWVLCLAATAGVATSWAQPVFAQSAPEYDQLAQTLLDAMLDQPLTEAATAAILARAGEQGVQGLSLSSRVFPTVEAAEPFIAEAQTTWGASFRFGLAEGNARVVVVVGEQGATIHCGDSVRIELGTAFARATVFATTRGAEILLRSVGAGVSTWRPTQTIDRVQVVAEGPLGPHPVAETSCDRQGHEPQIESWQSLLDYRQVIGRRAWRTNRLLDEVAQSHAEATCQDGVPSHMRGGDPETRLRARGIEARSVSEVIGIGIGAGDAFVRLGQSPSHRYALIDSRSTDAGLGIARVNGRTCVVILMTAWPHRVG